MDPSPASAISPQTQKVLNLVIMAVMLPPIVHNTMAKEYPSALLLSLQEVMGVVVLGLLGKGRKVAAAHVSCASILFLAVALVATSTHGVFGVAMMMFPAILLPVALLVERTWYKLYMGLSLVAIAGLELAHTQGWLRTVGVPWNARHMVDALIIQGTAAYAILRVGDAMSAALTKARKAEREERHAREETEGILSTLPDLLFQVDGQGRLQNAHVSPDQTLFLPLRDALGKTVPEFLPPDAARVVMSAIAETLAKGRYQGAVYSLPMPGGERWFELSMAKQGVGGEVRIITLVRDVTVRIRAEQRLRLLNAGFLSLGPRTDENITRLTRLLAELVGADCACLMGQGPSGAKVLTSHQAPGKATLPQCCQSLPKCLDLDDPRVIIEPPGEGACLRARRTIRLSDGSPAVLGAAWYADKRLDEEDRNLIEIVAAAIGLEKERAQFEARYLQAQKMESIGRLAGGVAHDLNNQLTPILGYADFALMDPPKDAGVHEALLQIRKAAQNSRDLVQQLLAVSRKSVVQPKILDLNAFIADFLPMLSRTLGTNITVESQLAPDLGFARLDPGQFTQVMLNLAVNAQEAMPGGGVLRIQTQREEAPGRPAPAGGEGKRYLVVRISDTGQGMPPEVASRCFEPFFTTKDRGTGLGLATVYGILEHHGGFIKVDSRPGRGTTFALYLPESAAPVSEIGEEEARTPMPKTPRTVLIVEDNPTVRTLAERILRKQDLVILAAETAEAALGLPEEQLARVDLLLTDVMLPGIHGRELFARLSPRFPRMRVIYMSGYAEDILEKREVAEGTVGFLQKPFTVTTLSNMVAESLARAQ
jgi:PAS domain S-box-containing protein